MSSPSTVSTPPELSLSHAPAPSFAVDAGRGPTRSLRQDAWRRFRCNPLAVAGVVYLLLLVGIAVAAPVIAPQNPVLADVKGAGSYRQAAWITVDNPKQTGRWDYPLGTDSVGRDVLSRLSTERESHSWLRFSQPS